MFHRAPTISALNLTIITIAATACGSALGWLIGAIARGALP